MFRVKLVKIRLNIGFLFDLYLSIFSLFLISRKAEKVQVNHLKHCVFAPSRENYFVKGYN